MEAMEMKGVEGTLGEFSVEEEESLVRNRDSVDVMKSEVESV